MEGDVSGKNKWNFSDKLIAAALMVAALLLLLLVEGAFRPGQPASQPNHDPKPYTEEELAKTDEAIKALRQEAEACIEELELLIPKHERLLNAVRAEALALPEKGVPANDTYDRYRLSPAMLTEWADAAPGLTELLIEMRNAGLEWEELRISPKGEISFLILSGWGSFGGSSMFVEIDSPPLDLNSNVITVTEDWGIYWSVEAMAGI